MSDACFTCAVEDTTKSRSLSKDIKHLKSNSPFKLKHLKTGNGSLKKLKQFHKKDDNIVKHSDSKHDSKHSKESKMSSPLIVGDQGLYGIEVWLRATRVKEDGSNGSDGSSNSNSNDNDSNSKSNNSNKSSGGILLKDSRISRNVVIDGRTRTVFASWRSNEFYGSDSYVFNQEMKIRSLFECVYVILDLHFLCALFLSLFLSLIFLLPRSSLFSLSSLSFHHVTMSVSLLCLLVISIQP